MPEKKKLLDVWILEGNTVYRDVPYNVVTDWLQQGRLLPDDKVRQPGGKAWYALDKIAAFAPYLPKAEPHRSEDRAEALEPVELGFDYKRSREEEDEDVDMIPLIDISLVLLIFFMMTATVNPGLLSPIQTPEARHQLAEISKDSFWVGIDLKDSKPWFSFGKDNQEFVPPSPQPGAVVQEVERLMQSSFGDLKLRYRAHQDLPVESITRLTFDLQEAEARVNRGRNATQKLKLHVAAEVQEPKGS